MSETKFTPGDWEQRDIDYLIWLLFAKDTDLIPSESKVGQMPMEIDAPGLLARARGE
ncbi:hypothetical protein [Robbsia andropogonis]|uniref:hypothetical protein n=1 Tax=Robbsia andropogonis TaxID=28092 RepID=UPI0004B8B8E9|nr:hypothetical protein [Robbsia andropogonis]